MFNKPQYAEQQVLWYKQTDLSSYCNSVLLLFVRIYFPNSFILKPNSKDPLL